MTTGYQPLQRSPSSSSLLSWRESTPACRWLSECVSFPEYMLVSIVGVLSVTLGLILITHHSDRAALSAGTFITVVGIVFLTGMLVLSKDSKIRRRPAALEAGSGPAVLEAGRRSHSSSENLEMRVLVSTRM